MEMKEPAHFRLREELILTLKRTLINCNQESRTFGFDAACDCQLSRHSFYYSHSEPYIASLRIKSFISTVMISTATCIYVV